ncbi:MAG: DNA-binding response regulator [Acidimicrobiia bacterium]
MRVCALVPDMMDRSRLANAVPGIEFVTDALEAQGADVIVVDLSRRAHTLATLRANSPTARIIAFGPHVDEARFEAAHRDGADRVLARSRFFRDISGSLT